MWGGGGRPHVYEGGQLVPVPPDLDASRSTPTQLIIIYYSITIIIIIFSFLIGQINLTVISRLVLCAFQMKKEKEKKIHLPKFV